MKKAQKKVAKKKDSSSDSDSDSSNSSGTDTDSSQSDGPKTKPASKSESTLTSTVNSTFTSRAPSDDESSGKSKRGAKNTTKANVGPHFANSKLRVPTKVTGFGGAPFSPGEMNYGADTSPFGGSDHMLSKMVTELDASLIKTYQTPTADNNATSSEVASEQSIFEKCIGHIRSDNIKFRGIPVCIDGTYLEWSKTPPIIILSAEAIEKSVKKPEFVDGKVDQEIARAYGDVNRKFVPIRIVLSDIHQSTHFGIIPRIVGAEELNSQGVIIPHYGDTSKHGLKKLNPGSTDGPCVVYDATESVLSNPHKRRYSTKRMGLTEIKSKQIKYKTSRSGTTKKEKSFLAIPEALYSMTTLKEHYDHYANGKNPPDEEYNWIYAFILKHGTRNNYIGQEANQLNIHNPKLIERKKGNVFVQVPLSLIEKATENMSLKKMFAKQAPVKLEGLQIEFIPLCKDGWKSNAGDIMSGFSNVDLPNDNNVDKFYKKRQLKTEESLRLHRSIQMTIEIHAVPYFGDSGQDEEVDLTEVQAPKPVSTSVL